jgi:hypothetical protein
MVKVKDGTNIALVYLQSIPIIVVVLTSHNHKPRVHRLT